MVSPRESREDILPDVETYVSMAERQAVADLPHLYDRIEAMGLTQEYCSYRDRYREWRKGEASGAAGELGAPLIQKDFKGWYPNVNVWSFRRTLSYWIAVGFFQGSIFFMVSSFLGCYPDSLGRYSFAMTKGGYLSGKFWFLLCTYFMCIEAVNLRIDEEKEGDGDKEPWYWWPFYYRTALEKLEQAGAGPYPYYAAVTYFLGCLAFATGMATDFLPLRANVSAGTKIASFIVGSVGFCFGGFAECIENGVFRQRNLKDLGKVGALLNFAGSFFFLLGALCALIPGPWGDFLEFFIFGIGSTIFVIGSGVLIVMWKDNQFGLTFFTALNHLMAPQAKGGTFSLRGAIFVMIYGVAATLSFYDFMMAISDIQAGLPRDLVLNQAFNSLLPCVFVLIILTLTSAMTRAPKESPFRQVYFGYRFLVLLMIANSGVKVVKALTRTADDEHLECALTRTAP